jgi:2-desacetyl-2-hydroxyethyl bacteriochlorophyllide A dehydrogenase
LDENRSKPMNSQTYQKLIFRDSNAELVEKELPPLNPDQVLVKTRCSLISPGTERAALTQLWDDEDFRASPGYALVGDVVRVGEKVEEFKAGDRVITLMNHASFSITSADPWVTLAIPEGVTDGAATFLPLASVALHAIRRAQVQLGETFAVIGAGIIGLIAIQLARMNGARKVIALDLADNRLELASAYGADVTINPDREDAVERLMDVSGGRGSPIILEATGNTFVIPMALKLAAIGGRIVCVGVMEEKAPIALHKEFIQKELSLIAAFQPFCPITDNIYWRWTQQENRRYLLSLMESGQLRVEEMITHRFKAARAPEAYERVRSGDMEMLGALLEWD